MCTLRMFVFVLLSVCFSSCIYSITVYIWFFTCFCKYRISFYYFQISILPLSQNTDQQTRLRPHLKLPGTNKYVNNVFFWFIYFRQVIITLYIKKLSISACAYFEVCLKLWWTRELDNTGNNALPTQTYYMGWDEHFLLNVWFAVSTADCWKMCTVTFHRSL